MAHDGCDMVGYFPHFARALWLAVIAYYFYFWIDPKDHFNQLGSLRLSTEVWMLGLPMAAVCMGFFQMAMRDRAGVRRHAAPIIPQR
jgi:hypothetical protein